MNNKFLTKIEDSDLEIITSCPICSFNDKDAGGNLTCISQVYLNKKLNFCETSYCNTCSFLFRTRRPSIEWFYKYWGEEDKIKKSSGNEHSQYIEKRRYKRYSNLVKICEKEMPIGNVLDIGTGTGFGLKAFMDSSWDACGVEPDESRSKIAKNLGLKIFSTSIEKIDKIGLEKFDLVLLLETLEHFHNPINYILKIKKLIKNGGYIYIEVPDFKNYTAWSDALYWLHMQLFNKFTLNKILRDAGFTPIKWYKPKTAPFGSNHVSVLAKKIENKQNSSIQKISLNETKKGYQRFAEKELSDVDFPIKYSVNSLSQSHGIGVIPSKMKDGFFELKTITNTQSVLRAINNYPKTIIIKQLINKVIKNKCKDPEFENTYFYD